MQTTWSRQTADCERVEERLSDAKIYESSSEDVSHGLWLVIFIYRAVQFERLLNASNETLLFGHISNPTELQALKNNSKMVLMKHRGLLEKEGRHLLDSSFQPLRRISENVHMDAASVSTRLAIETMLEELAPNLWEDDLDRLVDFGHIISPELEMKILPVLQHGEVVNIDVAFMVYVAHESGFLTEEEKRRIIVCMKSLGLPVWHSDCTLDLVLKSLTERLEHSGGFLRMSLPTALGKATIFNDTEESIVLPSIQEMV